MITRSPRLATAALLLGSALFAGCEHKAAVARYNPQLDSVLPTYFNAIPDTGILEDQRTAFNRMRDANAAARPAAPAAVPAPAAGESTPVTPPPPG
jgi:hypothetical protein